MAVSTIPAVNIAPSATGGDGISGSTYIESFTSRIMSVRGHMVTMIVVCTTHAIPAWAQFLTIGEKYRNSALTFMRIAANKNQSSNFVAIAVNPASGAIIAQNEAIPANTLLSFTVTYTL